MKIKSLIASLVVILIVLGVAGFIIFDSLKPAYTLGGGSKLSDNQQQSPMMTSGQTTPAPSAAPQTTAQTYNVTISNFAFSPQDLTIKVGDTVVWMNKDAVIHNIRSDSGNKLNSPNIAQEQKTILRLLF